MDIGKVLGQSVHLVDCRGRKPSLARRKMWLVIFSHFLIPNEGGLGSVGSYSFPLWGMKGSWKGEIEAADPTTTLGLKHYHSSLLVCSKRSAHHLEQHKNCFQLALMRTPEKHISSHIPRLTASRSCFLQWPARLPLPTYISSCGSHMLIVSLLAMPNLISCSPICFLEISSLCSLLVTCPSYAASQEQQPQSFEFLSSNSIPLGHSGQLIKFTTFLMREG